jgi:putative transposase
VTICVARRQHLFGTIVNSEMHLSGAGIIVAECWNAIPAHFEDVMLDAFVVMPDHVHGLVIITAEPATPPPDSGQPVCAARSLGAIVGSFKSAVTKRINAECNTPGAVVWQRNYFETIVRDQQHLASARNYIRANPLKWSQRRNET